MSCLKRNNVNTLCLGEDCRIVEGVVYQHLPGEPGPTVQGPVPDNHRAAC